MQTSLDVIDLAQLRNVHGGFPNGLPTQPSRPEPKTWIDGLNQGLRDRGFNPNIDPGMVRPTPNPDMDRGIERQFDGFAAPRSDAET